VSQQASSETTTAHGTAIRQSEGSNETHHGPLQGQTGSGRTQRGARSCEELRRRESEGIRYATFRLDDGVTFVHIAEIDSDHNPLTDLQAFKDFQEGVVDRCDEPPITTALNEIGSFHLFARKSDRPSDVPL
jgi:hypothetical protein